MTRDGRGRWNRVTLACTAALLLHTPLVATELWVSVAVSFEPVLDEALELHSRIDSGVNVHINSGGSALLAEQILRGAPADLFVGASTVELDRLERKGLLLAGSRNTVATNALVVVVPTGSSAPASPDELGDPAFRLVAVGNPRTAPLGRYTEQALDTLGLRERLADRLVAGENARQVLEWVGRGEVDAGIVYTSDAGRDARVVVGPALPPASHDPVRYETAILSRTSDPAAARAFLQTLHSAEVLAALRRHGFGAPP